MKRIKMIAFVLILLAGCAKASVSSGNTYKSVDQETAMQMMEEESDYIILDVRTIAEYEEGHLPDAINLPNERINDSPPELLPDLEQTIFVYCRSGRRSKDASQKLADMGYTGIVEIGGIQTWPGEIVTD